MKTRRCAIGVRRCWVAKAGLLGVLVLGMVSCNRSADPEEADLRIQTPELDRNPEPGAEVEGNEGASGSPSQVVGFDMEDPDARVSYGIGYRMGTSMAGDPHLKVDAAAAVAGLRDGLAKRQGRLDETQIQAAGEYLRDRKETLESNITEEKLEEARAFLARNGARPGVEVEESGLQYEVLAPPTEADGVSPGVQDRVSVHYEGTLVDGTVFDSSLERGEPISFQVRGVIPGWVEALQSMGVGEKRRIYLPPTLGYGSEGAGPVPPNAVLIFEMELLGIEESSPGEE